MKHRTGGGGHMYRIGREKQHRGRLRGVESAFYNLLASRDIMMPFSSFDAEFDEHAELLARCRQDLVQPMADMLDVWVECVRSGGKIMIFGNGGSAADAQHIAAELVIRYKKDRAPIAAIALTTDSSILTAGGNDIGFDNIFARQVEALGRPGDVALGISTSGRSPNVIRALQSARQQGLVACALGGGDGGQLPDVASPSIIVPSSTTARIQEMHILVGHMLCDGLERALGLVAA